MQLILQVVSGAAGDLNRIDASRLILWLKEGQSLTVGRSGDRSDFTVAHDARMSGAHFIVSCESLGCRILDTGSTNGTFINGLPIKDAELRAGDIILAGETVFDVRIEGEAKRSDAPLASRESVSEPTGDYSLADPSVELEPSPMHLEEIASEPPDTSAPAESVSPFAVQAAIKIHSGPFSKSEADNLTRLIQWIRPGETISYGRTKRSDVAIPQDERLTSLHFEVECRGRKCLLRDMGSRNGTFLNDLRIEEAELQNGDLIRAGTTSFRVGLVECDPTGKPANPIFRVDPGQDFSSQSHISLRSHFELKEDLGEQHDSDESEPVVDQMRVVLTIAEQKAVVQESRVMSWFGAGQSVIVGRAADKADMAIQEDQLMSGAHFEVSCDGHRCRLRDLNSRNGTYVNGHSVDEVVVCNGDVILAGRTTFAINIVGGAAPQQTLDFATAPMTFSEEPDVVVTLPDIDTILAGIQATSPKTDALEDQQAIIDRYLPSEAVVKEWIAEGKPIDGAVLNRLDLKGVKLKGAKLTRCTFTEVDFEGASLRNVDFSDSIFVRVNFTKADLTNAKLKGTTWSETNACEAKLHKADLSGTTMVSGQAPVHSQDEVEITFAEAKVPAMAVPKLKEGGVFGFAWRPNDFSGANLKTCRIEEVYWDHVLLAGAQLSGASIRESRFSQCDFSDATFKRTKFDEVDLKDCTLGGVDLSTSYLNGVKFNQMNLSVDPVLPRVLPACGFSDCNLVGRDFSFCNLRDADLSRVDFAQVKLADAQLRGANLRECNLTGIHLVGVDLTGTDFSNALMVEADLTDSNLTGADLSGANLKGARLSRALLKDSKLRNTNLNGAALVDAVLDHAELMEVSIEHADLRGAKLEGVDLSNVDFATTDLGQTQFPFCLMKGASFRGMNLSNCVLQGSSLDGGDLSDASLEKIDCRQANFANANLSRANFRNTNCEAAKFMKCIAVEADFSNADLRCANFEGASATQAKFEKADLEKARLVAADFSEAVFTEAKLQFADLSNADLSRADLANTDLTQANLHLVKDDDATRWLGSNKQSARGTDKDRAAAELWQPPRPKEQLLPLTSVKGR
jgi:uncharacterized protein YjbI with pentapeptide repeats/pSer/pThr/pTyr-binding forkhead associated (FHA) protein